MNGGRVLVAAGGSDDRESIRRWLSDDGMAVQAVADGPGALSALREGTVDLLLLDVALPRLDGVAVVDAVRRDPVTASLPIVVLGGPAGERSVLRCIEMGADDVLWTPLAPAPLRARVAAGLARAWLRERERECREQMTRLAGAMAGERDGFRGPGPDAVTGGEDPFGLLGRLLSRMDEELRECEHRLRRSEAGPRDGTNRAERALTGT